MRLQVQHCDRPSNGERRIRQRVAVSFAVVLALASAASAPAANPASGGEHQPAAASLSSLPLEAQSGISAELGRNIAAYQAKPHGSSGLEAENARHKLSADFTPAGVEVRSQGEGWRLGLRAYGYAGALEPVAVAIPQANSNRVEYRRGLLTEWYVNGPLGLEQGFTLDERPSVTAGEDGYRTDSQPLTIVLDLSGDLTPAVDPGQTSLTLTGGQGQPRLRYTGLAAYDATGRELRAWLELQGERLLLMIEDTGARYPVVIDPYVQLAELTASDGQANDNLGYSAAISGDTVVVGAPFETRSFTYEGAVYVFVKPPSGWANVTQTAKLTASDAADSSLLGWPVSISGSTIVAGAVYPNSSHPNGEVYVFAEPTSGWVDMTETAKLTALDGAAGDRFGCGAAISGNTIIIGACAATVGANSKQGAAYVFLKPASGWKTTSKFKAKLTALDGAANSAFGASSSISGSTVVIGAYEISNSGPGAAYVYVKPSGGWADMTETAKLTASDGAVGDGLGFSVSISGSTVVAGAPFATVRSNAQQGAAYVFVEPVGGWANMTQTAKLTAAHGAASDNFGWGAAISGNKVAVGAPGWSGGSGPGATYLFVKPASGWATTSRFGARLTALDGVAGDSLGVAVAISGTTVVATAINATVNGNQYQGAAYVFGP
jgi:hypothetical protein